MEAIVNAVIKIIKTYRSKEFDKLLVVADPVNDVDFVKDVSFYSIRLIFVIYFVTLCTLYSTLFSSKWALDF